MQSLFCQIYNMQNISAKSAKHLTVKFGIMVGHLTITMAYNLTREFKKACLSKFK